MKKLLLNAILTIEQPPTVPVDDLPLSPTMAFKYGYCEAIARVKELISLDPKLRRAFDALEFLNS